MKPLRPVDAAALLLVGAGLAVAVTYGVRQAAQGAPRSTSFERAVAVHAGVDPLRPPGLPSGAGVDPETGRLVGISLHAGRDEVPLDWGLLARGSAATSEQDVPPELRALDGRRVVVAGFQLALYELHAMREFMLVGSHYTCCFGRPPGFGDQILVRLDARAAAMDATAAPVRVAGTFRIRPQHLYEKESGPLISLFEIVDAEAEAYDG